MEMAGPTAKHETTIRGSAIERLSPTCRQAAMSKAGSDEKVYPVLKLTAIVDALAAEGVASTDALSGLGLTEGDLLSPSTRVSLNQVIECHRNAARLTSDPFFAYHTGLRFHVSTYGIYGFALLSSMNFTRTMHFAERFHDLATPTVAISFSERGDRAAWTIIPLPHPRVDASLYKFLVELQFGIHVSLQRDLMGPLFVPQELQVTYDPPDNARMYPEVFGCPVVFNRSENKLIFDVAWLKGSPKLGNEVTYLALVKLCDGLMADLQLRRGVAGQVREILLMDLMRPTSFDAVASRLHLTTRTLRRKLREENTSYRALADELRMQVAIQYLRDTNLTTEEIAYLLGFSDTANFRRAFRRWTQAAPLVFRDLSLNGRPRPLTD